MADAVFGDFLRHMNTTNPNFDIKVLLPELVAQSVIEPEEKAAIEQHSSAGSRAIELCATLPSKGTEAHRAFVQVLRDNNYKPLADFLETKLNQLPQQEQTQQASRLTTDSVFRDFLRYVNTKNKHFDFKTCLPQLLMQGVIGSEERAHLDQKPSAANRAIELCLTYLPGKEEELQLRFIEVLRRSNYKPMADVLESGLKQLRLQEENVAVAFPPIPDNDPNEANQSRSMRQKNPPLQNR